MDTCHRSCTVVVFILFMLFVAARPCAAQAVPPATVLVTVNPDGTFSPATVNIHVGDTVKWVNLARMDAIAQIQDPGAASPIRYCGANGAAYDHLFISSDQNEFTGPMRNAVSGIFAMGPVGRGLAKIPSTQSCACESVPRLNGPGCVTTVGSYRVCRGQGRNQTLLDDTWNNPDITGIIIRIYWSDLQKDIGGVVDYDFSALDALMDAAIAHGKVFALEIHAGKDGTPPWIFNDYTKAGPHAPPGTVVPWTFKDWGSDPTPPPNSCGYTMRLGSPADPAYINYFTAMLRRIATHIEGDSRWFQALSSVKLTGMNLLTGEGRLPKRCFDGNGDGVLDTMTDASGNPDPCICNPKVWAAAGYTPTALFNYYRTVSNTIYEAFLKTKTIGYPLIQEGFPLLTGPTDFDGDDLFDVDGVTPLLTPAGARGVAGLGPFDQTMEILKDGREGQFDTYWLPTSIYTATGKLFVPQHNGLGPLPDDSGLPACSQHSAVPSMTRKAAFALVLAGGNGDGCPNRWAVDQGTLFNQAMGFQTNNAEKVASPAAVDSCLWNMTINSNAMFIELYEERLWEISQSLGTGARASLLDYLRASKNPPFSKNLYTWGEELHERRRNLVVPAYRYLADPFPVSYEHAFIKPIASPITYYYVTPSRCATATSVDRVGHITVSP